MVVEVSCGVGKMFLWGGCMFCAEDATDVRYGFNLLFFIFVCYSHSMWNDQKLYKLWGITIMYAWE